ncbi:hypothetical protein ACC691_37920, partial [Rhizobium johnstonii]
FKEMGTTTTPFDMVHLNDLDRYRLALDVLHRVPGLAASPGIAELADEWTAARENARTYAYEHGEDPDWVTGWTFAAEGVGMGMAVTLIDGVGQSSGVDYTV